MKIFVQAKPGVKKIGVKVIDATHLIVAVREPAREGRANEAIRKALAEYFDLAPSLITLTSGATTKQKTFEIPDGTQPKSQKQSLF
ncbi:MAG: DUF167 domain-containing protein [Patescibacteria group bacterium]